MKPIIVFYSYGGNTKKIAEMIHEKIGGDLLQIDTAEPYRGSYNDVVNQDMCRSRSKTMNEYSV